VIFYYILFCCILTPSTIAKKVEELSLTADLHLKPSSSWFGKNSKRIPEPEFGFLVQVR
jgi:hypothetical protein